MDITIEETQRFALGAFRASAALFYWISDGLEMQDEILTGLPADHIHRYKDGMEELDPLNVKRLTSAQRNVGVLSCDHNIISDAQFSTYQTFLTESSVTDVMDLIFWHDGYPFAGLGIHKTPRDPPFCSESLRLAPAVHSYIEFNLRTHARLRPRYLRSILQNRCGLTPREIDVTDLVRCGCTNQDIASDLGIAIGTVKTHLIRIFEKLGTENRAALVARLNMMEGEGHAVRTSTDMAHRSRLC